MVNAYFLLNTDKLGKDFLINTIAKVVELNFGHRIKKVHRFVKFFPRLMFGHDYILKIRAISNEF